MIAPEAVFLPVYSGGSHKREYLQRLVKYKATEHVESIDDSFWVLYIQIISLSDLVDVDCTMYD